MQSVPVLKLQRHDYLNRPHSEWHKPTIQRPGTPLFVADEDVVQV